MNLYHWDRIKVLENYKLGDLIVMAETVDDAREIGFAALTAQAREEWSYFFDYETGKPADGDYEELWREKLKLIATDIRAEPKIVESGAVCIRGSD